MSVRTCQFCGKPLSRIWTGGGDYCSREHRNQHRLRLGMDRLAEANKVASLMRRRENLKPISTLQPVISAVMENRIMSGVTITPATGTAFTFKPSAAVLATPSMLAAGPDSNQNGCLPPVSKGVAGKRVARVMGPEAVRVRARAAVVVMAPRKIRSAVQLRQAPLTMPKSGSVPARGKYRSTEMLRHAVRQKLAVSRRTRRTSTAASAPFQKPCGPRRISTTAIAGMELRVSKSQGFRPPKMRMRAAKLLSRGQGRMMWKDVPFRLETARELILPDPTIVAPPQRIREPRLPGSRQAIIPTGKDWPAIRTLACAKPKDGMASERHVEKTTWNATPQETSLRCEWYQTEPRITFGYAEEPRKGAAEAAKPSGPPPIRVQENFDSGCANWVEGVADWRLDAAGARTGSLAFYGPSMQLSDYDLEFLVRVENRTASWVFRAVDTDNYYRAVLRVTPEGGYEFARSAKIGGTEEAPVSAPVAASSKTRTALAVRTSIKGSSFAVFVDGQAIDQWSDRRLPTGGVGFGEAPDDRARLYWVRLTYSEGHGLKDVTR